MSDIAGLPYQPLEFTKAGVPARDDQRQALGPLVAPGGATDLIAISHGWNNDMADAAALYRALFGHLAPMLVTRAPGRRFAVAGVLWPSKKFTDEDLIPGRAAGPGGAAAIGGNRPDPERLKRRIEALRGVFDGDDAALDAARAQVDALEDSPKARRQFVKSLRALVPATTDALDDASDAFFERDGDALLAGLKAPVTPPAAGGRGGAAGLGGARGGAAGLGDTFNGFVAAAWRLLNYTTYYQMKERAGQVGAGLNGVLAGLVQDAPALRLHLIGHSFGARVVAAAASGPRDLPVASLSLLQGAFSHNGFAARFDGQHDGVFREVLARRRVAGPIVVTHTANDTAVGLAYPIASRLKGDNRLALGDENDPFGGIGRNGAIKLAATEFTRAELGDPATPYALQAGRLHNMRADRFIADHGDVTGPAVANLVAQAIVAGGPMTGGQGPEV